MTELFQVGDRVIHAHEIPSLLGRYQLMPQFLRGIIIDEAIAGYTCTEEERQGAIEQFIAENQLTTPEVKEAWLRRQSMTTEQLETLAIQPVLLAKFKQATWGSKVDNYFMSRKSSLDQVVYSLIRVQDKGLAFEIFFRVKEGEQSFAELAREYSQGPESRTGGLVGPAPLTQPHPTIASMLAVSQPGQLWPPRILAEWFIIIRLENFIPAQLDESMRHHLINEMFETWLQEQLVKISPFELAISK